jgi:oligoendopeptidase F
MSTTPKLDNLPEWNLSDLYSGPDSSTFASDMAASSSGAKIFTSTYKGKLAGLDGETLAQAVKDYEALSDLIGRVGSYAQLYYVGDTTESSRSKFYGDVNSKLTDISSGLLFFELEVNLIDDAALEKAMKVPALAHYRPWIENLRMERPYQLDDKLEQLFLEKSQTGFGAFNRLFDETMASLRFNVNGEELTLEPTLNLMQSPDEALRKAGSLALAKTFGENIKLFTLITNTLAKDKEISDRWRGFKDIAEMRHLSNRVEPAVVDALVAAVREAYPKLSHRYYKMKAKWLGKEKLMHWDRNAPLPAEDTREVPWNDAQSLWRFFA